MIAIKSKVINEINLLPKEKLNEIYNFIHFFRLGLQKSKSENRSIMKFAGTWNKMSEKDFNDFSKEIKTRRETASGSRRDFESSIDWYRYTFIFF